MSTFGTYNIAYSGMYTSQSALASTSANLANVSTTGASRVRVAAADTTNGSVGTGCSVAEIRRARNYLYDQTYRSQNAKASYYNVKNGNLSYCQEILSEFDSSSSDSTDSDGLQSLVEDFFSDWEELSKDPSSQSNREAVTEAATSLLGALSEIDGQLSQLQADAVNGVTDGVDSLNDLAKQVADLNQQIKVESKQM